MDKRTLGGLMYSSLGGDYISGSFIYRTHLNVHVGGAVPSILTPIGDAKFALFSCTNYVFMGVNTVADNTCLILPPGISAIGFPQKEDKVSFLSVDSSPCDLSIIFPGGN